MNSHLISTVCIGDHPLKIMAKAKYLSINSFTYSLNRYLLSTYSLPGTILDSGNRLAQKKDKILDFISLLYQWPFEIQMIETKFLSHLGFSPHRTSSSTYMTSSFNSNTQHLLVFITMCVYILLWTVSSQTSRAISLLNISCLTQCLAIIVQSVLRIADLAQSFIFIYE